MPKYNTMSTKALGDGTKHAAWHLQVLAVLPEHQNKGIGKSLMKAVESKVGYLYYYNFASQHCTGLCPGRIHLS